MAAGCLSGAVYLGRFVNGAAAGRRVLAGLVVLRWTPGVIGAGTFVRWPRGWDLLIILFNLIYYRFIYVVRVIYTIALRYSRETVPSCC